MTDKWGIALKKKVYIMLISSLLKTANLQIETAQQILVIQSVI